MLFIHPYFVCIGFWSYNSIHYRTRRHSKFTSRPRFSNSSNSYYPGHIIDPGAGPGRQCNEDRIIMTPCVTPDQHSSWAYIQQGLMTSKYLSQPFVAKIFFNINILQALVQYNTARYPHQNPILLVPLLSSASCFSVISPAALLSSPSCTPGPLCRVFISASCHCWRWAQGRPDWTRTMFSPAPSSSLSASSSSPPAATSFIMRLLSRWSRALQPYQDAGYWRQITRKSHNLAAVMITSQTERGIMFSLDKTMDRKLLPQLSKLPTAWRQ